MPRIGSAGILVLFALGTVAGCNCNPAGMQPPRPEQVEPPSGYNGVSQPVTIRGKNFFVKAVRKLEGSDEFVIDDNFSAVLELDGQQVPLGDVQHVDSETLEAVVPAGIALGTYTLTVTGPYQLSGTLADAYQATDQAPPVVFTPTLVASPEEVFLGGTITLSLSVSNTGRAAALGLVPSVPTTSGTGSVQLLTGPLPESADVDPGGQVEFVWTYEALTFGQVVFESAAAGANEHSGETASTGPVQSDQVRILECSDDAGCHNPTPICNPEGRCAECANDGECSDRDPATPNCDVDTGSCLPCVDSTDCGGNDPICDNAGVCVPCTADSQCSDRDSTTPRCDVATGACVECLGPSDCGGATPHCDPSGACAACTEDAHCDDGDPCTTSESCQAGTCLPGPADKDLDGDGYIDAACAGADCDDNPAACGAGCHPGGSEGPKGMPTCSDGWDNDCDTTIDTSDPDCVDCLSDAECDDADVCNGRETCVAGSCVLGTPLDCDDTNECTTDGCDPAAGCYNNAVADGTECGSRSCTGLDLMKQTCVSGACSGSALEQSCDDANDCTIDGCDPAVGCSNSAVADDTECGNRSCSGLDWMKQTCTSGACTGSALEQNCDDANDCTSDACDPSSGCTNTPLAAGDDCGLCLQCDGSGSCIDDLDQDTDCPLCQECATGGACTNQGAGSDVKVECDDTLFCNGVETCDGSGACQPGADPCSGRPCDEGTDTCQGCTADADCPLGDICWPTCSADTTGCVTPPTSMSLTCGDPVMLPDNDSICDITLSGGTPTNQEACLTCYTEVGLTSLAFADFDDGAGNCADDGWTLQTGDLCTDKVDNCIPQNGPVACCDDFSSICETTTFGTPVLRTDRVTNCGLDALKQWRLEKTFNATDLTDLEVCFEFAEDSATNDEGILLFASDSAHPMPQPYVFCSNEGPLRDALGTFLRTCVGLPAWADGSPDLNITFIMHSNNNDDILFLRNIDVHGWGGGCAWNSQTILRDEFNGCDLSAWTVVSGTPTCLGGGFSCNGSDNLVTENMSLIIERSVDASALDGQVELCFDVGEKGAGDGESMTVEFDAGSGWRTAWSHADNLGPDNVCTTVCLNLSALDPEANNNPALGIRLDITSNNGGDEIIVDNVVVRGAVFCPVDAGVVDLSSPPQWQSADVYRFTATDVSGTQLTAKIQCTWDPDIDIGAEGSVWYQY
jgi:hypothetical protein